MNLWCRKVISHGIADPARLQEARVRGLGEFAVHKTKLTRVRKPDKVAKGMSVVARRITGVGKKASSHGLADPARLQEERTRRLGELAMQESFKRHERGGSTNLRCKKVNSNGLADPARLQEARARWLGEIAVQESRLTRVSKPGKVATGMSVVARRTCGVVNSNGLADPARLQEARARWLGEIAVQESRLTRVSKPGKVATGMSVVARRTCGVGKKVRSHGFADSARLQEARARWLSEFARQENKIARISRLGKVARSTGETRQGCKKHGRGGSANLRGRKIKSHGLADSARLQEARARWLSEFARQENKIARISRLGKVARSTGETRQGCKKHGRGGSANLRGRKIKSHGLADSARLQEARARWLSEFARQENKIARISRLGKVARSTGETRQGCKKHGRGGSANLRGRKIKSHGLADSARLQEARARWLSEFARQENKIARISRLGKVARSTGEVAQRICEAGK
ncbi:hypothetical protein CRG98_044508 [Punica granatum]|uniref:Uncharacterized protein n=1 Tax=Punica granatum TaxID=22663 RepID=A0A2I0HTR9_PUNGR|nr:hypothetical protein CRG98_044508 [Punica granatum]